jgi:hypothetical protein
VSALAHISGLPVEETIAQLAPAGLAAAMALRLTAQRTLRWVKVRHDGVRSTATWLMSRALAGRSFAVQSTPGVAGPGGRNPMSVHRRRIFVSVVLAAAVMLVALSPVASARPDAADFIETHSRDVFVSLGASLRNPTSETPASDPLYNVVGLDLGVTWGEWQAGSASSRVNQVGSAGNPRSDVRIDLTGLIPGGVYSIFYATIGPDSVNPKCPDVERSLPVIATHPDAGAPDASSFIADANGTAQFRGSVDAALLDATQPNRGEYLTQGPDCRSSYGHDAMRQFLILQQW